MKLHLDKENFKSAIIATSNALNIRQVFIEKDYWVTFILYNLSKSNFLERVVFKGGTSLSKAYGVIHRFSEDVDLVVVLNDENENQIKALIRKIEKSIAIKPFEEVNDIAITPKGSRFRKTVWQYLKETEDENFGDASKQLILEINSFVKPSPFSLLPIRTYIAEYLLQNKDHESIDEFGLHDFKINVLNYKRTFVEKISAITRACFESDASLNELKRKIRHLYDITMLYRREEIKSLFESGEFTQIHEQVRKNDIEVSLVQKNISEKNWREAVIFTDTKNVLEKLKDTYHGQFKTLIYNLETMPALEEIELVLKRVLAM